MCVLSFADGDDLCAVTVVLVSPHGSYVLRIFAEVARLL